METLPEELYFEIILFLPTEDLDDMKIPFDEILWTRLLARDFKMCAENPESYTITKI